MRITVSRLVPLLLLIALNGDAPELAIAETKAFVGRPRPLPEARSFFVSEIGLMTQVVGKNVAPSDDEPQLVVDDGVLFNTSEKHAVGVLLHGEVNAGRSRLGPVIRVRRWMGRQSSVDLQAGAMLWGGESNGIDFLGPSPHVQATINANDVIAIQAQGQLHAVRLRGDYPHVGGQPPTGIDEDYNEVVMHLGVRMGTVPGVFATVILGAIVTFWAIGMSSSD